MARYHEIAEDLRARIQAGEWAVGQKLPGISALQEHYGVEKSLGTIRAAQQLLVADGMLRTEQGVGAFVTATKPQRRGDVNAIVAQIKDLANEALTAAMLAELDARRAAKGTVTLDLRDADDERWAVLDEALRAYAKQALADAKDAAEDDNPGAAAHYQRRAATAEGLLAELDAALG